MEAAHLKSMMLRFGGSYCRRRLNTQEEFSNRIYKREHLTIHIENIRTIHKLLKIGLMGLGLYGIGKKNSLNYKVVERSVSLPHLPQELNGFRVLQLSDLHADAILDNGEKLTEILKTIETDLCVITGDFRFLTYGSHERAVEVSGHIARSIKSKYGVWGVLGNHDFLEMVAPLEKVGIGMLVNESIAIRTIESQFLLAGVDDHFMYQGDNIDKAMAQAFEFPFSLLLSHSPEIYRKVEASGAHMMLSGHTHGGQICVPGGMPVITNAACPSKYCSGSWHYKNLSGYTSRGTGCSGLPVRFFCPPEITVHTLFCSN